jgi:hypothetical protein
MQNVSNRNTSFSILLPLLFTTTLSACTAMKSASLALEAGTADSIGNQTKASYALQVYPGCALPPATPHNKWYIDPVNGSASGDGSAAHPWNSMNAVFNSVNGQSPLLASIPYSHVVNGATAFAPNPNAPIQPGDSIELMSGNYGSVGVGNYDYAITNSDFVTIEAAPGQTPVFTNLIMISINKLYFKNIKIQSLLSVSPRGYGVIVGGSAAFPYKDLIFHGLSISSQDDVSAWSQADWLANAINGMSFDGGGASTGGSCVAAIGNTITNVRFGVALMTQNSLFTNNTIDNIGDDFIDYAASNLTITHNQLTNSNILGDGNHQDFMQGQIGVPVTGVPSNNYSNILIDSNLMIRQTNPTLKFPGYVQGIDLFDSDWTNMTITNNIIITSSCWGIGALSMHGGLIAHNTVLADLNLDLSAAGNCTPFVGAGGSSHEGSPTDHVTVENNIVNQFGADFTATGNVTQNNVCSAYVGAVAGVPIAGAKLGCEMAMTTSTGAQYFGSPGTVYGISNEIDQGTSTEFTNYKPDALTYDVTILPGSLASQLSAGANPSTVGLQK